MSTNLHIVLIQSDLVWENPIENRRIFTQKINTIQKKVDLIVLPEMFTTGFSMHPKRFSETMTGETVAWLRKMAQEKDAAITGSIIITENGNYYNRLLFVHPDGTIDTYDKKHLFSYGREDKVYTSGNTRSLIMYKGWKICPLICYDLRFPVWSRNTVDFDILLYVANWPKARISAWDTLLKARAIENMCYTIGLNRVGVDGNQLEYNGHSGVYNCLGKKTVSFKEHIEKIKTVTLEKKHIKESRNKYQFLKDKD